MGSLAFCSQIRKAKKNFLKKKRNHLNPLKDSRIRFWKKIIKDTISKYQSSSTD